MQLFELTMMLDHEWMPDEALATATRFVLAPRGDPEKGITLGTESGTALLLPAQFAAFRRTRRLHEVAPPELVLREAVGRVYRTLAFAHPGAVDRKVVDAFTSHHRDRAAVRRIMETARRLLPELDDCFELERIACPVLLVWGSRDRMVSPRGAERILAALPDTRLELIDGCGHCPQIEAPERLVDLLVDFPERVARAA